MKFILFYASIKWLLSNGKSQSQTRPKQQPASEGQVSKMFCPKCFPGFGAGPEKTSNKRVLLELQPETRSQPRLSLLFITLLKAAACFLQPEKTELMSDGALQQNL